MPLSTPDPHIAPILVGLNLPIVLTHVAGSSSGAIEHVVDATHRFPSGWTDVVPELGRQPQDFVMTESTPSAFWVAGVPNHLRGIGVTQVEMGSIDDLPQRRESARR